MPTKNNKYIFIAITGLLILTTILSIGFYVSRPQSSVVASANTVEQSLPNQNEAADTAPQVTGKDTLSKTVKDLTVEITSAKIISTGVEIGICYTTPDGGDWYPTPGHLFFGTYEIYPDQYGFTTEEKADGNKHGKRCVLVYYRIDDLESITAPIQFSIDDFEARPLEMFSACQNFQERLATSPKAKAYGLRAKCIENSDGSFSVMLDGHAASVAKDKANQALDEIAQGLVTGPWVFTIDEIER
jgi:hypothetical protein